MKITLEATATVDTVAGKIPARIWEGTTESGVPVKAWIAVIQPQYSARSMTRIPSPLEMRAEGLAGLCRQEGAYDVILDLLNVQEELVGALQEVLSSPTKSADKDNMEFTIRVTTFTLDKARAALAKAKASGGAP